MLLVLGRGGGDCSSSVLLLPFLLPVLLPVLLPEIFAKRGAQASAHFQFDFGVWVVCPLAILAEGAIALSVTLSGGALFAS